MHSMQDSPFSKYLENQILDLKKLSKASVSGVAMLPAIVDTTNISKTLFDVEEVDREIFSPNNATDEVVNLSNCSMNSTGTTDKSHKPKRPLPKELIDSSKVEGNITSVKVTKKSNKRKSSETNDLSVWKDHSKDRLLQKAGGEDCYYTKENKKETLVNNKLGVESTEQSAVINMAKENVQVKSLERFVTKEGSNISLKGVVKEVVEAIPANVNDKVLVGVKHSEAKNDGNIKTMVPKISRPYQKIDMVHDMMSQYYNTTTLESEIIGYTFQNPDGPPCDNKRRRIVRPSQFNDFFVGETSINAIIGQRKTTLSNIPDRCSISDETQVNTRSRRRSASIEAESKLFKLLNSERSIDPNTRNDDVIEEKKSPIRGCISKEINIINKDITLTKDNVTIRTKRRLVVPINDRDVKEGITEQNKTNAIQNEAGIAREELKMSEKQKIINEKQEISSDRSNAAEKQLSGEKIVDDKSKVVDGRNTAKKQKLVEWETLIEKQKVLGNKYHTSEAEALNGNNIKKKRRVKFKPKLNEKVKINNGRKMTNKDVNIKNYVSPLKRNSSSERMAVEKPVQVDKMVSEDESRCKVPGTKTEAEEDKSSKTEACSLTNKTEAVFSPAIKYRRVSSDKHKGNIKRKVTRRRKKIDRTDIDAEEMASGKVISRHMKCTTSDVANVTECRPEDAYSGGPRVKHVSRADITNLDANRKKCMVKTLHKTQRKSDDTLESDVQTDNVNESSLEDVSLSGTAVVLSYDGCQTISSSDINTTERGVTLRSSKDLRCEENSHNSHNNEFASTTESRDTEVVDGVRGESYSEHSKDREKRRRISSINVYQGKVEDCVIAEQGGSEGMLTTKAEDITLALSYDGGYPVVTSRKAAPRNVLCYTCGSGGDQMIHCVSCAEPFHFFCIELQFRPKSKEMFVCRNCTRCHLCLDYGSDLKCVKCMLGFHPSCVDKYPPARAQDRSVWVCYQCAVCMHCGATAQDAMTLPGPCDWDSDPWRCGRCARACLSGLVCLVCGRTYHAAGSNTLRCMRCAKEVHRQCIDMSEDEYGVYQRLMVGNEVMLSYECHMCDPRGAHASRIKTYCQGQVTNSMEEYLRRAKAKERHLLSVDLDDGSIVVGRTAHGQVDGASDGGEDGRCVYGHVDNEGAQRSMHGHADGASDGGEGGRPGRSRHGQLDAASEDVEEGACASAHKNSEEQRKTGHSVVDNTSDDDELCYRALHMLMQCVSDEAGCAATTTTGYGSAESMDESEYVAALEPEDSGYIDIKQSSSKIALIDVNTSHYLCSSHLVMDCLARILLSRHTPHKPMLTHLRLICAVVLPWVDYDECSDTVQHMIRQYSARPMLVLSGISGILRRPLQRDKEVYSTKVAHMKVRLKESLVRGQRDFTEYHSERQLTSLVDILQGNESQTESYHHWGADLSGSEVDGPVCALCRGGGDKGLEGRLIYCGVDLWVHVNCALWSEDVYEEEDGTLVNVPLAIDRGKARLCSSCRCPGATLGCVDEYCDHYYHLPCAIDLDTQPILTNTRTLYCSRIKHNTNLRDEVKLDLADMLVLRRLHIPDFHFHHRAIPSKEIAITIGSLRIHSLGTIGPPPQLRTSNLVPLGYEAHRLFWGVSDPENMVIYSMSTMDEGPRASSSTNPSIPRVKRTYSIKRQRLQDSLNTECQFQDNIATVGALLTNKGMVRVKRPNPTKDRKGLRLREFMNLTDQENIPTRESFLLSQGIARIKRAFPVQDNKVEIHESKDTRDNGCTLRLDPLLTNHGSVRVKRTYIIKKNKGQGLHNPVDISGRGGRPINELSVRVKRTYVTKKNKGLAFRDLSNTKDHDQDHVMKDGLARAKAPNHNIYATEDGIIGRKIQDSVVYNIEDLDHKCKGTNDISHRDNQRFPRDDVIGRSKIIRYIRRENPQTSIIHRYAHRHSQIDHQYQQPPTITPPLSSIYRQDPHTAGPTSSLNQLTNQDLPWSLSPSAMQTGILTNSFRSYNQRLPHAKVAYLIPTVRKVTDSSIPDCIVDLDHSITDEASPSNMTETHISPSPALTTRLGNTPPWSYARLPHTKVSYYVPPTKPISVIPDCIVQLDGAIDDCVIVNGPPSLIMTQSPQEHNHRILYTIKGFPGTFSATKSWNHVTRKYTEARKSQGLGEYPIRIGDGWSKFGLDHRSVVFLIEQLVGASDWSLKYDFKYQKTLIEKQRHEGSDGHRQEGRSTPWCASDESRRRRRDPLSFLLCQWNNMGPGRGSDDVQHTKGQGAQESEEWCLDRLMEDIAVVRSGPSILAKDLRVCVSSIEGRGLFTRREYARHELIIEYLGETIRPVLADLRTERYLKDGTHSYMFSLDEQHIIDATHKGNAARFINHSCQPNCYSRIVNYRGAKHILILAQRRICEGEELTYDYRFPVETRDRLSCMCASAVCRGFLN